MRLIVLAAGAFLAWTASATAQVQLPTAIAPNGTVRSQPSAVIVPSNPAAPGGAGCTVGATGCSLPVTVSGSTGTSDVNVVPSSTLADGIAPAPSASAESCKVLKASAGNLYSVSGYAGQAQFIQVFNLTAAPADGAVTPVAWAYTPIAGSWSIDYGTIPAAMSVGITVCASTTGPLTKTAIATNNVFSGRFQ